MNNTVGIVWNPAKGDKARLSSALAAVRASSGEIDVVWFETTPDDSGKAAATAAVEHGCDLVIAAGGDGTVRAVASFLGSSGSPAAVLGVVPLGTGNLLARNLGLPLGNLQAAFERALTGRETPLDLGRVSYRLADGMAHDECFVVMAGFGIDAQMIVETDDDLKARAGWLAYVESLGRAVAGSDVVDLTIRCDEGATATASAHTLLIANCGTLQGGLTLLPDARPDDGELDYLLLSAEGVAGWLDTMRNVAWDNGLKRLLTRADSAESSASARHGRATDIRVGLPAPLEFEIDGDSVGEVTSFEVRVSPGALRIRV